jgi:uncharacterized membrane protein
MVERFFIGVLSVFGLLISAYFAAVYHKVLPNIDRYVPRFCRPDSHTCATVLQTSQARLFGFPNVDLGLLYYASLLLSAILPTLWTQLQFMLLLGSIVTIVAGFYLAYVLVFQLHVLCTLCFASHAVNFLIFFFLLAAL